LEPIAQYELQGLSLVMPAQELLVDLHENEFVAGDKDGKDSQGLGSQDNHTHNSHSQDIVDWH
jgi:hypothetical protein